MKINQLEVEVYPGRPEMGVEAARRVEEKVNELLREQPTVNIIFAAAPSQNEFLAALRSAAVNWGRVRAFHMDEYIGLEKDAVQGFGNFLRERIFGQLGFLAVHYIDGGTADPEA